MLVEIRSDVFDIVKRIKKIDKDYKVVFNTKKDKYELHNCSQKFSSYCLTFPYDEIDERMILYALRTSVRNKDKIYEEIEKNNEKIKKNQIKNTKEKILMGVAYDN